MMSEEPTAKLIAHGSKIAQADRGSTAIVAVYENVFPRPVDEETLVAARQKLAELPLETIPGIASSGSGWRMPFARNASFVGREADLRGLAAILKERERAVAIVTAPGGMGKTQLASEFVHRYGQYFAGVFWLSFADAYAVPAEIAACRTALEPELRLDVSTLRRDEQVQLVLAAWQNGLPRLLIFDSCEEETLFTRWRPPTGDCRVLVTSWRTRWDVELGVKTLPLVMLRPEESLALLRNHLSNFSPAEIDSITDDLKAIADELGHLPLALHLAGSFLNTYGKTSDPPRYYLTQLRQVTPLQHSSLQREGITHSTGHIQHVEQTFALSYGRLHTSDPRDVQALRLLARAAHFAPGEPILRNLLLSTLGQEAENHETKRQFTDALECLIASGLLEEIQEGGMVRLHRLLAEFVRARGGSVDTEAQTAVEQVLLKRARDLSGEGFLTLLPHLRVVTDRALQRNDVMGVALCKVLGIRLYLLGFYSEAQPYFQRALAICEQVLGPEHPDIADILNNLAVVYRNQTKYAEAEKLLERALAISRQACGSEHFTVAIGMNNLAELYRHQGKYAQAEPWMRRALSIREKQLEPEHPEIATYLDNLGSLCDAQGKYTEAEELFKKALAIDERACGPEHPSTTRDLNDLAFLYYHQRKYDEAEKLFKRVLTIDKKLRLEHPDTAQSLDNLGLVYEAQGKYAQAEPLYQHALAIFERLLGTEHPRTLLERRRYASLLRTMGRDKEATLLETASTQSS